MEPLVLIGVALLILVILRVLFRGVGGAASKAISAKARTSPLALAVTESVARVGRLDGTPASRSRAREAYLDLARDCRIFLGKSPDEIEVDAERFATRGASVPEGPILVQAAFLLADSMSPQQLQQALGTDRATNDMGASMFMATFDDFVKQCGKPRSSEHARRMTSVFAFMFYLLHNRAGRDGLMRS